MQKVYESSDFLLHADQLDESDRADRLRMAQDRGWDAVMVSATTGEGLAELQEHLRDGS